MTLHSAPVEGSFRPKSSVLGRVVARLLLVWSILTIGALMSREARAQGSQASPPVATQQAGWQDDLTYAPVPRFTGPTLKGSPGWSLGLHAQAGLSLLSQRDRDSAHAVAGVLARFQYGYFQVGGSIEQSDRVIDSYRSYGGFLGAFLPFDRWVDVDCTLGVSLRRHKNPEPRFGPGGYALNTPALSLAIGMSDRSSDEGQLGVRIGARLVATLDVTRRDAAWRYQLLADDPVTGATKVGGFSLGAMLTAGFDIARTPRRSIALR